MPEELWQRRFLLLVSQYAAEQGEAWGWKTRLAERLGQDASTINKITTDARPVTKGMINTAITKFPISPSFFYDEGLGDAPDYHDYIGRRVERDEDAVHPVVEQVIAARRASPEAAARLRAAPLRFFGGEPDEWSVASVLAIIEADVRREAAEDPAPKAEPSAGDGRRRGPKGR